MALREEVVLEIQAALRQLDQLQQRLSDLGAVVDVPVNIQGEEALASLDQQIRDAGGVVDIDVDATGLEAADRTMADLGGEIDQVEDELEQATRRADQLGRELDTTGSRGVQAFGQIRSAIGPLIGAAAAGIGFGAIIGQLDQAIDSATALEESINAVNVTFGAGADELLAFGENAAQSVGLAASQFNELVTPIGALLQNFNLDGREAAEAATELTVRAADLASVFNTEVQDALTAVGAALRGETEPIRRFGVNINQAALDAKALELGLVGVGEEVTIAARGQAAYAEILDQTSRFAGDFAATSEGAANQQRILAAEVEDARAALGDALLPTFEEILEVLPGLIGAVEDLAPALEVVAGLGSLVVDNFSPVADLFGDAASALSELIGLASDIPGDSFLDQILPSPDDIGLTVGGLAFLSEKFIELRDRVTRGFSDTQLEDFLVTLETAAEDAADPIELLGEVFERLNEQGTDVVPFLEDFAEALGLSDAELSTFVQGLILSSDRLGLTAVQVATLRDLLGDLGGIDVSTGGALVGFENLAGGTVELNRNLAATTDAVEGADRALLGLVSGSDAAADALEGTTSALPVIIRDLDDLAFAADEAGVSVLEFIDNVPENVVIDLSAAEQEVLSLIGALEEASARLAEIDVSAAFGDVGEVDDETDQISADIEQFISDLENRAGDLAGLEFDLSQIAVVAPNLAEILAESGLDASGIAAAFAENLDQAAEAEALIAGTEGLAAATAEQYAGFLAELTPRQVADLAVFGADNFVSPAIRAQLGESAAEVADVLTESLDGTVIQPEIIIDLSQVVFQNLPDLVPEVTQGVSNPAPSGGTGPPGGGGGGVTFQTEVNINNATTEDVSTSATQAAQTIQAVQSSMNRVQ